MSKNGRFYEHSQRPAAAVMRCRTISKYNLILPRRPTQQQLSRDVRLDSRLSVKGKSPLGLSILLNDYV